MAKNKSEPEKTEALESQKLEVEEGPVQPEPESVEPEPPSPEAKQPSGKLAWLYRAKNWYLAHKKLAIPLTVIAVLLLILAIPWTRYQSLGLVMKKAYLIQIIDSVTKDPVSGALVSYGSISAQTDGSGIAKLNSVKVGSHSFSATKKYYKDGSLAEVVPILSQKDIPQLELVATGRQVKVAVVNTINKKVVGDVKIKVADVSAQTDSKGSAALVLPPGVAEQKAELSLDGYVTTSVVIKVSDSKIEENKFNLTPAGKIYFLSKRTGKIDVMKSNLDGTDQSVVLAGTGKEDEGDTILLASRDWKYLALKSKRDGDKAKLFWIDTSVDKLNTLDEGDAEFTVIGWAGNSFIYKVYRNSVANWQPNREALKSFNATNTKLAILNQTGGVGTDGSNYAYEYYDSSQYIIDDNLVFTKNWSRYYYSDPVLIGGKQVGIYSINANGSNFKILKAFTYNSPGYISLSSVLYEPKEIYYSVYQDGSTKYYKYENGSVSEDAGIKEAYEKFVSSSYPTYLLSPSGKQTFWSEPRDGKSSLLVADADGKNEKETAKLPDEFQNYGYYTDEYLLVSKKSSELYVMPSTGVKSEAELIKLTDYHRPDYRFYGYGGGYGGL